MRSPFFERQSDELDPCAAGDCTHYACTPQTALECPCCKGDLHDPGRGLAPTASLACAVRVDLLLASRGAWAAVRFPHETDPDVEPRCRGCWDTGVVPTEEDRA